MFRVVLAQLVLIVISNGAGIPLTLPVSTDPNDVAFYLYPNPNNFSDYDVLTHLDLNSITTSRFSATKKNIFLTHGFIQSYTTDFPTYLIKAYLNAGFGSTSNIIAVDWGKLSGLETPLAPSVVGLLQDLPLYAEVVQNVPVVGKRIKDFIVFLEGNGKISGPSQVHLVGQSLGAQISGMAGMYYKQNTSTSLDRITGTDPAGPLFQDLPINQRLDSTDANFVDIVHTNQGVFGYVGTVGDADFFVNGGGPIQPACLPSTATNPFCSHNAAPHYYAQSIADSTLKGQRGLLGIGYQTATFGEFCPNTTTGSYYIQLDLTPEEVPPA